MSTEFQTGKRKKKIHICGQLLLIILCCWKQHSSQQGHALPSWFSWINILPQPVPRRWQRAHFYLPPLVPASCRFPPESSLLTEARISITWWENIWKCDQVPLGSIIKSPFTGINIISVGASRSSPHTEFLNHIFPNSFNLLCLNKSALLYNSSLEKMSTSCCYQGHPEGLVLSSVWFLVCRFASVLFAQLLYRVIVAGYWRAVLFLCFSNITTWTWH